MSAEFRTLCHSLGLSAQALARLERVQQRTGSGQSAFPNRLE